jgi:predicted thioesterase
MIALMEIAASRVLRVILKPGEMSVGVEVRVRHTAPTPIGAKVRGVATYLGPEGKLFKFHVQAFDEAGLIGDGEHTRAIIETSRLISGASRRKPS